MHMTLDKFLQKNRLSNADFARNIGTTPNAIRHYRKGRRKPRSDVMERIIKETKGKVTPNDFYIGTHNNKNKKSQYVKIES